MLPSSFGTRAISAPPNASVMKSRSRELSRQMIHGVTVP
jgi:hypothetical protein